MPVPVNGIPINDIHGDTFTSPKGDTIGWKQEQKQKENIMDDNLKLAFEIVKAQATTRPMTSAEMMTLAKELADGMKAMSAGGEVATQEESAGAPVMDPKKSIKENAVVCLCCGKSFKILSTKHLASHGLDKKTYCEKFGLKPKTSLAAKGLVRARKIKMTEMKLWERRGTAKKPAVAEAKPAAAPKKVTAKKAAAPKAE